jgi:hypothetical protein
VGGDLAGEGPGPELEVIRAQLALGFGDHGCRGDGPGLRERDEDRVQAEKVVAVAVSDVDRGEVLSGRLDPFYDLLRVLGGEGGVNQDRARVDAAPSSRADRQRRVGTRDAIR